MDRATQAPLIQPFLSLTEPPGLTVFTPQMRPPSGMGNKTGQVVPLGREKVSVSTLWDHRGPPALRALSGQVPEPPGCAMGCGPLDLSAGWFSPLL